MTMDPCVMCNNSANLLVLGFWTNYLFPIISLPLLLSNVDVYCPLSVCLVSFITWSSPALLLCFLHTYCGLFTAPSCLWSPDISVSLLTLATASCTFNEGELFSISAKRKINVVPGFSKLIAFPLFIFYSLFNFFKIEETLHRTAELKKKAFSSYKGKEGLLHE